MVPPDSTGIPRAPAYSGIQSIRTKAAFRIRDSHPLRSAVPGAFRYAARPDGPKPQLNPTTPQRRKPPRFRLFPLRSPLLRESHLISLPLGTEMFQFPRLAPALKQATRLSPSQVAPFGYPRIYARLQLPEAFRSLPRPSSPVRA